MACMAVMPLLARKAITGVIFVCSDATPVASARSRHTILGVERSSFPETSLARVRYGAFFCSDATPVASSWSKHTILGVECSSFPETSLARVRYGAFFVAMRRQSRRLSLFV